jgi:chromosome segregation ATPase
MRQIGNVLTLLALVGVGAYLWLFQHEKVLVVVEQLQAKVAPCQSPITYSLGAIDPRFGIAEKKVVANLKEAEAIWEKSSDKDLFEYTTEGGAVTVNFVYDERQAATDTLQAAGIQIDKSKATYDTLKGKYDALAKLIEAEHVEYERMVAAYKSEEAAFNAAVESWNDRGGAPERVYEELEQKKAVLQQEIGRINTVQSRLNDHIETGNALATTLNQLIVQLNLNVEQYNQTGAAQGEFEEGLYESSAGEQKIDIYEFSNHVGLVRVLAHEMGHALGIEHVADTEAIMYKINQGERLVLAQDDIAALNMQCSSGIF